jgi:hypothetical protein
VFSAGIIKIELERFKPEGNSPGAAVLDGRMILYKGLYYLCKHCRTGLISSAFYVSEDDSIKVRPDEWEGAVFRRRIVPDASQKRALTGVIQQHGADVLAALGEIESAEARINGLLEVYTAKMEEICPGFKSEDINIDAEYTDDCLLTAEDETELLDELREQLKTMREKFTWLEKTDTFCKKRRLGGGGGDEDDD